jgi:hypothetical protein
LNLLQKKEQVVKTTLNNTTSSVAPLNLEVVVSQPQLPQEQSKINKRDQRLSKMFERLNSSNRQLDTSNRTDRSHREIITSQSTSKLATKQGRSTKHYITGDYSTHTITKTIITKTWVPGTIEQSTTEKIETEGLEAYENGDDEGLVPSIMITQEDDGTTESRGAR